MKKIGVKISVILIAMVLLVQMTGITSIASDLSDVNKKIEEKEEEIDGIQEEKSDAMKEVATLTAQITDYQNQIDDLDSKINDLNAKINEAQKKVDEAQAEYDKNKSLAEERLVVMQESGDTTYLDMLLTSSSITDFISNYYLASELAEADTELLDSIEKERQEVENAKAELENSKKELDTQKASKQSVATQLQASKSQKDAKVASLSADEKQAQAELDQFEADKREIQAELARIAAEEAKNNGGGTYFEEVLEKIRDIRSSEKVFWRKILDIYATSVDYDAKDEKTKEFFKTVQNKMHYAVHGNTAAEVIYNRVDSKKENIGLTSFKGNMPTKSETEIAKNYLSKEELDMLNRMVSAYLDVAEINALNMHPMTMKDWIGELDGFLTMTHKDILKGAGTISHEKALEKAHKEYDEYMKSHLTQAEKDYLEIMGEDLKKLK